MASSQSSRTALIVTDMQPDFMPGGALPVPAGDELVAPVAALLRRGLYDVVVATQDWHPTGHMSFASSHRGHQAFESITWHGQPQTLWPDHCVQSSAGAALHPGLPLELVSTIIRKGMDPKVDSYSALRHNPDARGHRPLTGLTGYLRERGVDTVALCGLARDYCVLWSALDAVEAGFGAVFLWDLTCPVFSASDAETRRQLLAHGVRIQTGHAE